MPLVDTSTSSTGEVIQGRQVTELPLNGRNFTQLALLTPGVTRGAYGDISMGGTGGSAAETFRNADTGGESLVVNGLRSQANNFILDGVDNNEALVNSIMFFPPAEAIQEFRVNTSVAPAEFGRAGGAIVQTQIKSGTNQIHGSAFIFDQQSAYNPHAYHSPLTPQHRNQFGGTIGGPVWKNKIFLFADYQGLRQKSPAGTEYTFVPTALQHSGDFSELMLPANTSGPYRDETLATFILAPPAWPRYRWLRYVRVCILAAFLSPRLPTRAISTIRRPVFPSDGTAPWAQT